MFGDQAFKLVTEAKACLNLDNVKPYKYVFPSSPTPTLTPAPLPITTLLQTKLDFSLVATLSFVF